MEVSSQGLDFIKNYESLRLDAYLDSASVWTIGYGSTGPTISQGMSISRSQAETMLVEELASINDVINGIFSPWLNQWEHDAMASFLYNVGINAFNGMKNPNTTARAELTAAGLKLIGRAISVQRIAALQPLASAMLWWNKITGRTGLKVVSSGLQRRRADEAELLLYGDYTREDDGVVTAPGYSSCK